MYLLKFISKFYILLFLILGSFSQEKEISIDTAKINFVFVSKEVEGTIGDLETNSKIDILNFENSVLEGSVSLESLKTGNFLRDWHLMSKKYFFRQKYPRLHFKSNEIIKTGNDYQIEGILTMKGVSKSIQMKATVNNNSIQMTGSINTADWNIRILKEWEKNNVGFNAALYLK
ncbi:YceI family protein [Flavobacteriaceae bacterium M23B6Z8]